MEGRIQYWLPYFFLFLVAVFFVNLVSFLVIAADLGYYDFIIISHSCFLQRASSQLSTISIHALYFPGLLKQPKLFYFHCDCLLDVGKPSIFVK